MTEDEMVGWHHWLNGHEFEQALGVGYRQGSLACLQSTGSQRVRHDWAIELYRTDRKLPVTKVVESSDFTNERGNSCLCPYGKLISFEPHLEAHNDLPLSSVLRQISYFLLHILWSLLSWNEWTFFFSHYDLFIPSSFIPLHLVSQTLPETMLIPTASAILTCLRVV